MRRDEDEDEDEDVLAASVDDFHRLKFHQVYAMNHPYGEDQDQVKLVGFEIPKSPDSGYNNVFPKNEDEDREPPLVPPHLQHSLLNYPTNGDSRSSLQATQNVTLNHLYVEKREPPRSVVALGATHRFRSKLVTVVLYKPIHRR
ncbi:SNF1-related kinase regulatory subunit beta-3 [Olea europaea subsp. europaea]|uniref:SNF1-related kinase regulatory subunit beta-3 n=1 Tax=Olea europaea subsp. europaea TaxID=158383 RepID=A0A8S0S6G0_OLEEU|nr:SNF1-related kinase regulatory subunit beta-3 [Olea europaea subsp. europaea]